MVRHDFPRELLHLIYSQCSPADILSLRAVSKESRTIADEYFLKDVRLMFLEHDYKTVASLVQNPEIARSVRSVTFEVDFYKEDYFEDHMESGDSRDYFMIKHHLLNRPPSTKSLAWGVADTQDPQDITDEQFEAAMFHGSAIAKEQGRLFETRVIEASLRKVFCACARIDTIVIANVRGQGSPVAGKQYRKAIFAPWTGDLGGSNMHRSHPVGDFLFDTLLHASVAVKQARNELIHIERSLRNLDVGVVPLGYLKFLHPMMESLRALTITIEGEEEPEPDNDLSEEERKEDILGFDRSGNAIKPGFPPKLQQLSISSIGWMHLDRALRPYTWPSLTRLHIAKFESESEWLVDFLERHASSLVDLRMSDIWLSNCSSWEPVLKTIAETLPALQSVQLRGDLLVVDQSDCDLGFVEEGQEEDEFTRMVQRHILMGGDQIPESYQEVMRSLGITVAF